MTPSARIQAVIDLLEKTAASRVPMDATVGDYMRGRRYIGSKDRSNIVERLYNMVRAQARLGWHLDQAGAADMPRNRMIAWLALAEKPGLKAVSGFFDGSKFGPAVLSDEEKKLYETLSTRSLTDTAMPDAVRVECPPEQEESLRAYFGDAFVPEMEAMMSGASLDLRVNAMKLARKDVQASLEKDGVQTDECRFSPWGLRARDKAYLSKTKAFNKGWISIQDEGSQLIALVCGAKPGMQVLDYCAGAGGKTLALAAQMDGKGRIVAADMDAGRLAKAKPRFKKAGALDNVEVRPLSDERHQKWLKRQKGTFDLVLTDVPCSGTGTWRRNPDMRWRTYGPVLSELLPVQAEILDKAARAVKSGGRLVYATCSLLPEENERQIEAFLQRHEDFKLLPLPQIWPDGTPCPCEGDYLRLTPYRHDTDGFFAAALERASGS